jgi:hypothetical protein
MHQNPVSILIGGKYTLGFFFLNNHTWYFYGNSSLPIKLPKSMHSNLLNLNAPRVSFTPFGLVNELVLNKVGVKHW